MDNRDWSYCARYIDAAMEDFKNTLWNGLTALHNRRAPLPSDAPSIRKCPGCGASLSRFEFPRPNYCARCGQAFAWEDEDDGSNWAEIRPEVNDGDAAFL